MDSENTEAVKKVEDVINQSRPTTQLANSNLAFNTLDPGQVRGTRFKHRA